MRNSSKNAPNHCSVFRPCNYSREIRVRFLNFGQLHSLSILSTFRQGPSWTDGASVYGGQTRRQAPIFQRAFSRSIVCNVASDLLKKMYCAFLKKFIFYRHLLSIIVWDFFRSLFCEYLPRYRVIYSTVTASSTVSLWCWHSVLTLSIMTRASAVRPANASEMWVSIEQIFLIVLSSWSFWVAYNYKRKCVILKL